MDNTQFFTQCKNCEYCDDDKWGYYCEKHGLRITDPSKDGCTWGAELELDNDRT